MLEVDKLNYTLRGLELLQDVSFQVKKGEVLAILGANGAGKSTLMSLLCGFKKPSSGEIYLHGKALAAYDTLSLSKCRALLTQEQTMAMSFKVQEIVMMGRYPHYKHSPTKRDFDVVEETMALCGVQDFAERDFLSLSGGEKQRVQMARVLAQIWDNPDALLLLDEPISALDLHYQQKVLAIAKALSRKGFMVVLILHDVNLAAIYADRILMLKNGRKLFDGTAMEVLGQDEIQAVFSVPSRVVINQTTLKPYVQLEEIHIDFS